MDNRLPAGLRGRVIFGKGNRMDNNELSTNLASLGTDCISRQAAIDLLKQMRKDGDMVPWEGKNVFARIRELPTIQPDIVMCKDCKYAEYIDDVQTLWCTECGQGRTVAPNDFCSYAERREVTE